MLPRTSLPRRFQGNCTYNDELPFADTGFLLAVDNALKSFIRGISYKLLGPLRGVAGQMREELHASIEDVLERACAEMETGRLDVPVRY